MRGVEAPIDCAAWTYMFSRTETTALRMMREPAMPSSRPSMPMICGMPGPTTETTTIRMTRSGKLIQASTKRCTIEVDLAAEVAGDDADDDRDHRRQRGGA